MKKISATQTGEGPLVFSFSVLRRISLSPENPSCPPRTAETAAFSGDSRAEEHRGHLKLGLIGTLRLASVPCFAALSVSSSSPSISVSPSRRHAMKDTRPLEVPALRKKASERPPGPPLPPSYRFFITYYLCLTDLLQTNGCHMEKEKQGRRKEGRKEKTLSLRPLSPCGLPEFFSLRVFFL